MATSLGTAFVRVRGDFSHLNSQLVSTLAPTKLSKLSKGAGAAIGVGLAAGFGGKKLFDLGKSFDQAFDTIRVGSGETGKSLKGLEDDFKDVLKTTPTDFATAGDAIAQLNQRLGLSGEPLRRLSKQLLNLSRLTKTDLSQNIESVARAFEDWEVPVKSQTKALDGLFRLGQRSGASVAQLATNVQKFGSPLRILGFSLGEAAATFATFERAGVNIQTTVPGLKLAISNLTKPSADLGKAMKELGISATSPEKGLKQVFELLGKGSDLDNIEKRALAMEVFGKRAGADMAEAIRQGRFEVDEMFKTFARNGDTISKAERDTRDFSEEWQILKNRLAVALEPVATGVFKSISDLLKIINDPDLSGAQKWDKISTIITSAFEKALEGVVKAAVTFGPKIALALAKGFLNAPPLIQLLTGGFLLKKAAPMLASAGLLGREAGTAFSAGMATTATAGTAALGAGAAGGLAAGKKPKAVTAVRRAAAGEIGALGGGAVALTPAFRSGAPVSQLGPASKGLTRVNAALGTMMATLAAAPFAFGALAAAVVIAGKKIKDSKTFEGKIGGLIDEKAAKIQVAALANLRSGLDELTGASQQAKDSLPAVVAAEAEVARLRKVGKTDTHAYAEAVRALDTAEAGRIIALRHQSEAQKKVFEGTREDLRAAVGRLGLDRKIGASQEKLRDDIAQVAQAYSRQAAAQLNVSRGMRGLSAITGPTGTKMGALLKTLKGVEGFKSFKKLLITADISQAQAAVRLVERLRTLGREKTALKIVAESKSPEAALKSLREKLGDITRRAHTVTMQLKDQATLRLDRLKRTIDSLPERKKLTFDADVALTRRLSELLQRAGLGPAAKQLRLRAKGGIIKRGELSLVGEEGFELAKLPGGKMQMLGQEGPEVRELPVGTRVYSHPQTKQKLVTLTQRVIQKLVPASIRQPESLTQQLVQETLGTKPGKASAGAVLPGTLGALKTARALKLGGVVEISREDERKRRRGQPPEATESGKQRDKDLDATKASKPTGSGRAIKQRAGKLDRLRLPYDWGGNHGLPYNLKEGFDCSSAVSYVLGISPRTSGQLAGYGAPGKGPVSVFANAKHTFMSIFGRGFGTSPSNPGGGAGWLDYNARNGFTVSHLAGVHTPSKDEAIDKPRAFKRLSLGQYVTVAKRVGFPDPALAAAIFYAESMGKVNAVGDSGKSLGAAQIHTPSHPKYDHKKLRDDVFYNMRAALDISKKGRTFQPWTQYRNGAYKQFLKAKAAPLPKGKSTALTGSKYTDYLEMRMLESESTPSFRDDLRWINRAMRYWRGVVKRNRRAGNIPRINEGLRELQTLRETKKGLKAPDEAALEEVFELGGLSKIGTGPNAFNIAGMQGTLDQIDLEKAQASLTIPADTDDSFSGLAKSLQDDIAAASKLVSIRGSIHNLAQGFQMPDRAPRPTAANPFIPSKAQSKALAKTKTPQERITLLNRFIDESVKGPFIQGTIKQKIEAATDLATARSEWKSLKDEAGQKEEPAEAKEDTKKQDLSAFLAALRGLVKERSNLKSIPAFAQGGISKLPLALVGEQGPELVRLPIGSRVHSSPESQRMARQMGIPSFASGGVIESPTQSQKADPSLAQAIKRLEKAIKDQEIGKTVTIDARQRFEHVPPQPHLYSRSVKNELEAALT